MTEQLPITIKVTNELIDKFLKITSVANKLEAQFNFHTLTANWYGDENNVLRIQLALETPASFLMQQEALQQLTLGECDISNFSDDVVCCFNEAELQYHCYVAITESEVNLLEQAPKILAGFIQAKLHKVLNLIAVQQSLAIL